MYDQYERSYKIEKCKEKFAWEVEKIVEEKLVDTELDTQITFSSSILIWASFLIRMFGEKPRVNLC